tara:strand:- start:20521 stop:20676 length:156 start_codon:yes stop_codon:yes gene_type:complete
MSSFALIQSFVGAYATEYRFYNGHLQRLFKQILNGLGLVANNINDGGEVQM